MTRMIPPTINTSTMSAAERKMFEIIRDAPDTDGWVCFHSYALAHHATKRHGEVDFLLVARQGVFALEVKGGGISHDDGVWYSVNRKDERYRLKESPFDQAAGAMHEVERCIKRDLAGRKPARALFGFGVVFPDVEFTARSPEWDQRVVYDSRDRQSSFISYVDRLKRFHRSAESAKNRPSLKRDSIEELAEYLRADFDAAPSANLIIDGVRKELKQLTLAQRDAVEDIDTTKRVIFDGGPGTGKTVLAVDAAERLADAGHRVLFVCFNKLLAAKLASHVASKSYPGEILVRNIDDHFVRVTKGTEFESEVNAAIDADKPTAFATVVPEYAALAASEQEDARFDALILDEAQDFLTTPRLDALNEMLHGNLKNGRWYVFLDKDYQAGVYANFDAEALARLAAHGVERSLWRNCRNTAQIAMQTAFVCAARPVRARVDGDPVDFKAYRNADEWLQQIEQIIFGLRREAVSPGRVSVLFSRTPKKYFRGLDKMGLRRLTEADIPDLGTDALHDITWATVSGFKGLENDVIILVGVEKLDDDWYRSLAYAGMSRARTRLHVLIHEDWDKVRRQREKAWQETLDNDTSLPL